MEVRSMKPLSCCEVCIPLEGYKQIGITRASHLGKIFEQYGDLFIIAKRPRKRITLLKAMGRNDVVLIPASSPKLIPRPTKRMKKLFRQLKAEAANSGQELRFRDIRELLDYFSRHFVPYAPLAYRTFTEAIGFQNGTTKQLFKECFKAVSKPI